MKLKLAEYKDGKFERFLELGKDFMFGGEFIFIHNTMLQCHLGRVGKDGNIYHDFYKDKKDPLNRFDGLFDGRTYGGGRFVLIVNFEDDVYRKIDYISDKDMVAIQVFTYEMGNYLTIDEEFQEFGNIHENPELWEMVKYQLLIEKKLKSCMKVFSNLHPTNK